MGVVSPATDRVLGREVTVKILQKYDAVSSAVEWFADEARITGDGAAPEVASR